ncbi:hypothetical protein VPH35_079834 [Triticum aestivum]
MQLQEHTGMLSIPELHDHIACDRVWSRRLQHWHDNMLLDMGMAAAAIHAKMAVLIIIISFLLDVLMLRLPVTSVYQPTSSTELSIGLVMHRRPTRAELAVVSL